MKTFHRITGTILALLCLNSPSPAQPGNIIVPGQGWGVLFDFEPLLDMNRSENAGNYVFQAKGKRFSFTLSVITPSNYVDAKGCYEYYWARARRNSLIKQDTVKVTKTDLYYRVEYNMGSTIGDDGDTAKHVNYYIAYHGKWVDLHIAVPKPTAQDLEWIKKMDASLDCQELDPKDKATPAPGPTAAQATGAIEVVVPKGDKLGMRIPEGWTHNVVQPPNVPPTVNVSAGGANPLVLKVTWIPQPDGRFLDQGLVDKTITQFSQQYVGGSVEKKVVLKSLASGLGHGTYCTFTEAKWVGKDPLPEGEFRCVTTGLMVVGKQAGGFTLLTNQLTGAEYQQALQILTEGISIKAAAPPKGN